MHSSPATTRPPAMLHCFGCVPSTKASTGVRASCDRRVAGSRAWGGFHGDDVMRRGHVCRVNGKGDREEESERRIRMVVL